MSAADVDINPCPDDCVYSAKKPQEIPCASCSRNANSDIKSADNYALFPDQPEPTPKANSRQEGGSHYITLSVQPWAAMASWMSRDAFNGFLRGNVIKYVARDKGGIEDLKKARHYLDKLIENSCK